MFQGSLVIEPAPVPGSFAYGQPVDTTGKGMHIDNDMHAVRGNGIVRDLLQIRRLLPRVQLRAGQVGPRRVGCGNTQHAHPGLRQMVDILGGDERGIAAFEDGTALGS